MVGEDSPQGSAPAIPSEPSLASAPTPSGTLRALWGDRAGLVGLVAALVLVVMAIFAPLLAPHDPVAQSLSDRLLPPWSSGGHGVFYILGTDGLGRDILSRLVFGGRVTILVGLSVVLLAGTFGALIGAISGYKGGRVDSFLMRIVDIQVAFPGLLLALLLLTVIGPSMKTVILVMALSGWMVYARLARGVVLSMREMPYVEAAEIVGCRPNRVIFRHILPNLATTLLTLAVLEFARIVLAEAALSYLGLGIQPPQTSWGLMVAEGQDYIFGSWWVVTFPGVAIAVTVLGINLMASSLRIAVDPHEREKRFAATASSAGPGTLT